MAKWHKVGDKWEGRGHIRFRAKNKAEVIRFCHLVESAFADVRRKQREKARGCCSIGEKLDEFLSDSQYGLGDRRLCGYKTLQRHRRRLMVFDKVFKRIRLDAIDRPRIERWVKRRLKAGVTADTVRADLISLHKFARWAQDKEYCPSHLPLLLVPKPHSPGKLAGQNRRPPKVREIQQLKRIIAAVKKRRKDMGLFLVGMALFGRRPEAVAAWKREHVTLPRAGETGRLKTRGLKGRPDRELEIPPGSKRAAWVRKCLALGKLLGNDKPRDPLVPCLADRNRKNRAKRNPGGWTTESFGMALARMVVELELDFTAYQIRHSCVSWLQTQKEIAPANSQGYADHGLFTTQNAYSHRHNRDAEIAYRLAEKEFADLI